MEQHTSVCPVCKQSTQIKQTWRAGYQYACEDCDVLFNTFGGDVTLFPPRRPRQHT
ncbi:hypothetical protein [Halocatena marina]|uniref:hypothetical protein n=1 Tax=Halocatena marina TaxID=2934937 RepID=UPI0020105892|nr:hypothetical protein [Halocatena marina]